MSVSHVARALVLSIVIQQVVSSARRPRRPLAAGYYISTEDVNFLGKSIRVKVHVRALDPTDDNRALMRVTIGGDGRDIEMPRYAEVKRYNALNTDRFFIPGEIGGSNNVFQRQCFTVERNNWSKAYFREVAQGLGIPPAAWVRPGFRLCPFGDSWVISLGRAGAYNLTYPVKLNEYAVVNRRAGFYRNSDDLTVTRRRVIETSEYNSSLNLSMVTIQASPSSMPPASATPTQTWDAPSYSDDSPDKTAPEIATTLPIISEAHQVIETPTMLPAVGSYVNIEATEHLNTVSLELSGEGQKSLVASLLISCITARCLQSTLPKDKPMYFYVIPPKEGNGDALVFAPPPLALLPFNDLCLFVDATERQDLNEIAEAFTDAGDTFEISNFSPAATFMCWSQDRAAWDLWLGIKIDRLGAVSPARVVPLAYTDGVPTINSSVTPEQILGENSQDALSEEADRGRTKRRRSSTSRNVRVGNLPQLN
ncbi:hypothetical protein FOZ63_031831 [Perkinsus olseni]|uniref:Cyclin-dependent kinase 8 n=1 Tax=Perkinsus olseni TaxID=32597 RepID=A0A7J6T470_PEROL|nr:hypothetical protein FOZ62_025954 [Perkinsus olseni]KAF4739895.1 hypothetical protein FOZ63_031831 [Perkinsus olseni]